MKHHQPKTVRSIALDCLNQWEKGHVYAESLIQHSAQKYKLSQADRNLLNTILLNTIRHLSRLDFWISQLREEEMDSNSKNLVRLGLCQLHILKLAEHASVNETVNCAAKKVKPLINALLRRSQRETEEISKKLTEAPLHVQFSHPKWLVDKWIETFDETDTTKLLKWNLQPSKTLFRINTLRISDPQEFTKEIIATQQLSPLESNKNFFKSEGLPPKEWINDGSIYIQDPATCHAVELLAPQTGEYILDACAAPGGKSTQIAAAMNNNGRLLCSDSNAKRLPRLEQNLSRLGVKIAEVVCWDWLETPPEHYNKQFDAILLDVPCSNTGVLARRIDAKWRISEQSISELQNIQFTILSNAVPCIKNGGRIVYSTCSIDPNENSILIEKFLKQHPNFILEKEQIVYPFSHKTDGAYAALLRNTK